MGSFLGITFVSNQNSTIFAASSLFPQSSILGLDHKQDILRGIPQGTALQKWLWWGEECWCLLMKDLLPPLPTGRRAGQMLWSLLPVIHLPLKRWACDGWQFTLPVLQWMVDIITVLKTAPSFSAPHVGTPGLSFLSGADLPLFLSNQWLGRYGRPVVLPCGRLGKWPCRPSSSLAHSVMGWACESNTLDLGWVVEACMSTSCQTQVLWFSFYQSLLWVSGACLFMKKWYFPIWLLSLKWVSPWSESKREGEVNSTLNI